jgi:hypothetical protein
MDIQLFIKGALLTFVLSCLGFVLLELNLIPYGLTLFCVLPILLGYALGIFPSFKISLVFAALFGLIWYFYLLYLGGYESLFCILTVSPFVTLLMLVGIYIGYAIRKKINKRRTGKSLRIYVLPLFILSLSGSIEKFFLDKYTDVTVETKILLPYPSEIVFDYIKSVDTVDSDKPFLLHIGIQVPLRCVLEDDSVGAKRVCYFKEGTIDEVVTEIKRGEILKMKITNYGMPGRKWLHFKDAIYLFKKIGDETELTRITTYRTELKPRFYWNYFETKAIQAEHNYVLSDLKRRLDKDFKKNSTK